jgi:hypothetical protein
MVRHDEFVEGQPHSVTMPDLSHAARSKLHLGLSILFIKLIPAALGIFGLLLINSLLKFNISG